MFSKIGLPEILIILAVVLLLFGATRLPQLGNSLGRSIREFKSGMKGAGENDEKPSAPAKADSKGEGASKISH